MEILYEAPGTDALLKTVSVSNSCLTVPARLSLVRIYIPCVSGTSEETLDFGSAKTLISKHKAWTFLQEISELLVRENPDFCAIHSFLF